MIAGQNIGRPAARALLTAVAYFLVSKAGIVFAATVDVSAIIWPAAGIAVAAALRYGYAGVLGTVLGSLATNFTELSPLGMTLSACGAGLEAWLARVILFGFRGHASTFLFASMRDVSRLFLVALPLGAAVSALLGAAATYLTEQESINLLSWRFFEWWSANLTGAMLITPVLLSANRRDWLVQRHVYRLEWSLVLLASVLMTWLTFNLYTSEMAGLGEFLIVPLVLWVALRFSAGAVSALVLLAAVARLLSQLLKYGSIGHSVPLMEVIGLQITLISISVGGLLVVAALSERRESEQRLDKLANHDPLTGLANRSYFQAFLEREISQSQRSNNQVSLLYIDLDRFKNINDSRGHEVGDEVLRVVAGRLTDTLRTDDFVARLGGDEFAVIMSHPKTQRAARRVALKLIETLSEQFVVNSVRYSISASIGISVCPDDGTEANALLRQADLAMYQAKQKKSGFEFFSREMNNAAHEQLLIENGLRQAILNDDFALLYQPKVDLSTGKLCGMEALIRWFGSKKGIVGPDRFIPVAEETGLIVPIGHWAVKTACKHWVEWKQAGLNPPQISVNLSPRQFSHGGLAQDILNVVKDTGMDPAYLGLEITESTAMENPLVTLQVLAEMGGSGIEMMIDDFGTGHSNLRQLKRLPINVLKIDKSFVRDIITDKDDAEITLAIIRLAHSMGLRVVAEGVETNEVAIFLKERKCDEIQGFLIGKPMPPEAITALFGKTFTFT